MTVVAYPATSHTGPMASSSMSSLPFAFAQVKGTVCLVQLTEPSGPSSPLMYSDVRIFRHEFITIFRYSHCASVHPSDFQVLEVLDERCTAYEEEKETVCLAREVMARMQRLSMIGLGGSAATQKAHAHVVISSRGLMASGNRMQTSRTSRVARIH